MQRGRRSSPAREDLTSLSLKNQKEEEKKKKKQKQTNEKGKKRKRKKKEGNRALPSLRASLSEYSVIPEREVAPVYLVVRAFGDFFLTRPDGTMRNPSWHDRTNSVTPLLLAPRKVTAKRWDSLVGYFAPGDVSTKLNKLSNSISIIRLQSRSGSTAPSERK